MRVATDGCALSIISSNKLRTTILSTNVAATGTQHLNSGGDGWGGAGAGMRGLKRARRDRIHWGYDRLGSYTTYGRHLLAVGKVSREITVEDVW